jgi:hypothetical protein
LLAERIRPEAQRPRNDCRERNGVGAYRAGRRGESVHRQSRYTTSQQYTPHTPLLKRAPSYGHCRASPQDGTYHHLRLFRPTEPMKITGPLTRDNNLLVALMHSALRSCRTDKRLVVVIPGLVAADGIAFDEKYLLVAQSSRCTCWPLARRACALAGVTTSAAPGCPAEISAGALFEGAP